MSKTLSAKKPARSKTNRRAVTIEGGLNNVRCSLDDFPLNLFSARITRGSADDLLRLHGRVRVTIEPIDDQQG